MSSSSILDFSKENYWSQVLKDKLDGQLTPSITRLNLSSCHIDGDCCAILQEFLQSPDCHLLSLDVSSTRMAVSEASMLFTSIAKTTIIEFYADDLILKEESIQKLAETLSSDSNIEVLSLCGCDLNQRSIATLATALPYAKNLKYLRLESNSMYSDGAIALEKVLPKTNLISLEIADNMIWNDGTDAILSAISQGTQIQYLDISYNVLNIPSLLSCLTPFSSLKSLAISGCKVEQQHVQNLIEHLGKSHLETFIMDGLDFNYLPITWPKVTDSFFSNDQLFNLFENSLLESQTLTDVRIGFLSTMQIGRLMNSLSKLKRKITITLQDFYRTNDFYVLHFPDFYIEGCDELLAVTCDIDNCTSDVFGQIVKNVKTPNGQISKLEITMEQQSDSKGLELALSSLSQTNVEKLVVDLKSYSKFTIDGLKTAISNGAKFTEITLHGSRFSNEIFQDFFDFLNNTKNNVVNITIGLDSNDCAEDMLHSCMDSALKFFKKQIREFYLEGDITPADALYVCASLYDNKEIRIIDINSSNIQAYKSPDPQLKQSTIDIFLRLAELLEKITKQESSLHTFNYPLFTDIYVDNDQILPKWLSARKKIQERHESVQE
ncbi:Leucine Rich Repeat family protein [Trichomonas vaginalis G3]|uniref:Leucine Rich Repeat family protein n=1 Tax=Trichomonas vaginalis (strain ATCC PRA-98 / G3) TaxID=412133 RepID=A2E3T4_TRIV3|nr:uncharacterized protein TVAGG3_0507240 [Trichomonas vaginalis G3]EAY12722.1 Leucine Rich Repeat family protein [Trichomonas vaginalis G3]KAI5517516.1 interleukin-8 biosynthetic process [Trichomonas vaginalis G3]|eukprot:XP_001324945.1 hypothetical protein [Trichomonas vaginalis G3]